MNPEFTRRAIACSCENLELGGGPFGAVVVKNGKIIAEGSNKVTVDKDPTAHAEVVAIRNAAKQLDDFNLSGCEIYTSCEPCPMCLATSLWARIGKVYFAADRHDAAKAGFDDAVFYEYFEQESNRALMPVQHFEHESVQYLKPFQAWDSLESRTDY